MILRPHHAHSLLSVVISTGIDSKVVRAAAKATPGSGWRFAENHQPGREQHVEFVVPAFVEALVERYGAPTEWRERLAEEDRHDRVFGEFGPLCTEDDRAARAAFNAKVENDRFNQPEPAAPEVYEIGAWVPSHRARLGV